MLVKHSLPILAVSIILIHLFFPESAVAQLHPHTTRPPVISVDLDTIRVDLDLDTDNYPERIYLVDGSLWFLPGVYTSKQDPVLIAKADEHLFQTIESIYLADFDNDQQTEVIVMFGDVIMNYRNTISVFEISVGNQDAWQVNCLMETPFRAELTDLDADAILEIIAWDAVWIPRVATEGDVQYWSSVFKPDKIDGGFYLANSELKSLLEMNVDNLAIEYWKQVSDWQKAPDEHSTIRTYVDGINLMAYEVSTLDSGRVNARFEELNPLFDKLSQYRTQWTWPEDVEPIQVLKAARDTLLSRIPRIAQGKDKVGR